MWFFRAVALDLDGTLTEDSQLSGSGMAAVKACRAERWVILVTGRVFGDLEAALPGLWREFDAVVTENGAVLHTGAGARLLASPVDPAIQRALADRGVPARAGQVRRGQPGRAGWQDRPGSPAAARQPRCAARRRFR